MVEDDTGLPAAREAKSERPGRADASNFLSLRPFTHDFGALITLPVSGVCESGFTSRTGPSAPPTLRSKHALNADVGSRHRNRDRDRYRDRYRDRTSFDPIARGAARDGSKWTIPIPIAIWMRASSGQSRDRTRSWEGLRPSCTCTGTGTRGHKNHAAVPTAWHSLGACHTRSSDVMSQI